ncbi:YncE family protein [Pedobacter changchengzhani]|uniref:YncE family protein n=1 Tax=Pedobacter changchengzhani TaxID=2529274 RepID=A0A4R5MHG1_9SPHI|nr:YncE family protein [Pedobacter changchengzhani]TDG34987.1 YncE family protein [Pedobacter changchengzhani]
MNNLKIKLSVIMLASIFFSCRKEKGIINEEVTKVPNQITAINGLYILNEGNFGSNKASLDYYDYANGIYRKNIYEQANPSVTLGLGDAANDIKIYGSRLYIVVNGSNKVEILDVKTAKKIGQVDVPNCRYISFYKNNAYVTAYAGYVAVIDTAALAVKTQIAVGQQPEEMAIVGSKLYVANSGGYNYPNYEHTVSVIDLNTNTELKRIDVDVNLHHLKADQYGDIYVTSRGNYANIPSNLYVIDTKTDAVKKKFNITASDICIDKDFAYIYSVEWSSITSSNVVSYTKINIKDETIIPSNFITDGTEKEIEIPYGLAIDPLSSDIYVTDAKDYVTPGTLYCFDKYGKKKFSVTTGDIPGHFAFYTK